MYQEALTKLPEVMRSLGYTDLRDVQKKCFESILAGEDTFCILPTGGGKTLLAIVPTLVFEWRTVIFSPLLALMQNQVTNYLARGVKIGTVNSLQHDNLNTQAIQDWINGDLQVLLIAPEQINNGVLKNAMRLVPPNMVVLDEAHSVSRWGLNFRPSYKECGKFIEEFNPRMVLAMTATAKQRVVDDVLDILKMKEAVVQKYYYPRHNLKLSSVIVADTAKSHSMIISDVKEFLDSGESGSVIIYCSHTSHCGDLAIELSTHGIESRVYHSKISDTDREAAMNAFMSNTVRVIIATNAFGMGVDKPDIRRIIHADPPLTLEAVAQETGRASRDGKEGICIMYGTDDGLQTQLNLFDQSNPAGTTLQFVYEYLRSYAENYIAYVPITDLEQFPEVGKASSTCFSMLTSLNVIGRPDPPKNIRVKFLKDIHAGASAGITPLKEKLLAEIKENGILEGEYYVYNLPKLAERTGMKESNLRTHLSGMHKLNVVDYIAPSRVKPSVILRDLTDEDMKVADDARAEALKEIQQVRAYLSTPDNQKQRLLDDYFVIK